MSSQNQTNKENIKELSKIHIFSWQYICIYKCGLLTMFIYILAH